MSYGTPLQDHRPAHILVVDDDASNRKLLQRVLAQEYQVSVAEDGQEALDALAKGSFDVVLLDVMMPVLTGLETLERIRSTPALAELPVILLTALTDTQDVVNGLQFGASDYITKPIDLEVVLARVKTQVQFKQLTDSYKEAIAQLQAAQQMKDRLFRIASHDLKAPLANLRMAEHLLREYVDHPQALAILDTMRETADGMKEVVESFLDAAVFHNGSVKIEPCAVDMAYIVQELVQQYTAAAKNKLITVETGETNGTVTADPARLLQVAGNLLSNAIKYSPFETTVTIWAEQVGGQIRLNVADQGPGIPPAERARLFQEFSKLSPRPTGGESSTGLGLWISKQLIEMQHGKIGVDCPADGGSVFWIQLPAHAA
jgi:signal transduction histidine kinase